MPEHSKYNSQNLVNLLPDWLVHFLWFLYEDIPPALRGQCLIFELTTVSGGQRKPSLFHAQMLRMLQLPFIKPPTGSPCA